MGLDADAHAPGGADDALAQRLQRQLRRVPLLHLWTGRSQADQTISTELRFCLRLPNYVPDAEKDGMQIEQEVYRLVSLSRALDARYQDVLPAWYGRKPHGSGDRDRPIVTVAISSTCLSDSWPAAWWPGFWLPLVKSSAFLIKYDVGGVFSSWNAPAMPNVMRAPTPDAP